MSLICCFLAPQSLPELEIIPDCHLAGHPKALICPYRSSERSLRYSERGQMSVVFTEVFLSDNMPL